jgi:hypothetical protein
MMEKLLFQENQKFRQPWLYAILLGSDLLILYILIRYSVFETEEFDLAATIILIVTLFIMILLTLGFLSIQLQTEIRQSGIFYRFKPFQKKFKEIRFEEIESVEVKRYSPIKEYGGWGFRIGGKKKGNAYNVSGNKGIYFVFKDGRKFLLGTQKPESVNKVLQRLTESDLLGETTINNRI